MEAIRVLMLHLCYATIYLHILQNSCQNSLICSVLLFNPCVNLKQKDLKATTRGKMWCLGSQVVALMIFYQVIFAHGTYLVLKYQLVHR